MLIPSRPADTKDKPFKCDSCDRLFNRHDSMLRHLRMHQRGPTAGGSSSRDNDDPPQISPSRQSGPLAPLPQTDAAWANSFAAFQRTSTPPIAAASAPPPPPPPTSIVPPIPLPSQQLAPPSHGPTHPLGQGFIGGGGVQFPPQPMATPMPTAAMSLVDGTDNTTDLWQLLYNDLLPGSDSLHTSPHFLDSIGLGSDLFFANQKPQAQVLAPATSYPPPPIEPMHGSSVLPPVRLPDQPLLPSTPLRAQATSLERKPSREVEHDPGRSQAAIREVRSLVADLVSMSRRAYPSVSLMRRPLSVQQSHHRRQPLISTMARPVLWPLLAKIPPNLPHPPSTNVQCPDNMRTAAAQHDRYRFALPPWPRRSFQGALAGAPVECQDPADEREQGVALWQLVHKSVAGSVRASTRFPVPLRR
jgi:hypothetical protein